jgi:two-component system response regulator
MMNDSNYILCIDDDQDDYQLLADALHNVNPGLLLQFEKSGTDGLKFLHHAMEKSNLPRLIVLDLNMPGMDGKITFRHIRSIPALATIPVLFFSTSVSDPDIVEFENNGVSIFKKPNTVKDFDEIALTITYLMP